MWNRAKGDVAAGTALSEIVGRPVTVLVPGRRVNAFDMVDTGRAHDRLVVPEIVVVVNTSSTFAGLANMTAHSIVLVDGLRGTPAEVTRQPGPIDGAVAARRALGQSPWPSCVEARPPRGPRHRQEARLAPVAAGALTVGVVAHLAPGAASWRSMRCRLLPRLAGVGHDRHVALTFDDGPDPVSTPAFLDALDGLGWQATFFCLGQQVRRDPDLTRRSSGAGHELGVHGDVHTSHLRRPVTWTVPDLRRARDLVADVAGVEPRLVPAAVRRPGRLLARRRPTSAGLRTVLWTSWGRDWRAEATPETVVADLDRTWHPGATVLLHDSDITSAPDCWRSALGALPLLAERWGAQGLTVGTLGQHGF